MMLIVSWTVLTLCEEIPTATLTTELPSCGRWSAATPTPSAAASGQLPTSSLTRTRSGSRLSETSSTSSPGSLAGAVGGGGDALLAEDFVEGAEVGDARDGDLFG